MNTSVANIKDLGTIMGIWAHPDDETFCSGGLMAQAVANGQKVICITATKGEKGIQDPERWPPDQLGDIRSKELGEALDILGIQSHEWLDYSDGECSKASDQVAVEQLEALIKKYQPNTIITFGADGLTGHPDHQAVSRWARQAAQDSNIKVYCVAELREHFESMKEADKRFDLFFNVTRPLLSEPQDCDLILNLAPELVKLKCRALKAMPSQYETMAVGLGDELFEKIFSQEAFKLADL